AFGEGGAIATRHSAPAIVGCTFRRNRAGLSGGCFRHCCTRGGGGAISIRTGEAAVLECMFFGNSCNGAGGAINIASDDPNYPADPFYPVIANCVITGNATINGYAGGIAVQGGVATIVNSTIDGNHCHCLGGGVVSLLFSQAAVVNCIIRQHHSNLNESE